MSALYRHRSISSGVSAASTSHLMVAVQSATADHKYWLPPVLRSVYAGYLPSGRENSVMPKHLTSVPVFGSLPVRLYTSPPFRCSAPFRSASTPHLRSGVRLPSGPPLHLTSVPVFGSLPVRLYTSPPFRCSAPFRSASTPHLRSGVRLPSGPPLHLTSVPVFGSLPVRLHL